MSEPSKAARERAHALCDYYGFCCPPKVPHDKICNAIAAALEEYVAERTAQLDREREQLQRAFDLATVPGLMEMHIADGKMDALIDGRKMAMLMAWSFWDLLIKEGARNYIEMKLAYQDHWMLVRLQRLDGKTPHELRQAAEAERDATRVEVEELRARVSELEGPSPKLPPGCKCDPQGWWPNDAPPICSTCEEDVGIHVGCCRHCSHLTECHADRTDGGQGHE